MMDTSAAVYISLSSAGFLSPASQLQLAYCVNQRDIRLLERLGLPREASVVSAINALSCDTHANHQDDQPCGAAITVCLRCVAMLGKGDVIQI